MRFVDHQEWTWRKVFLNLVFGAIVLFGLTIVLRGIQEMTQKGEAPEQKSEQTKQK